MTVRSGVPARALAMLAVGITFVACHAQPSHRPPRGPAPTPTPTPAAPPPRAEPARPDEAPTAGTPKNARDPLFTAWSEPRTLGPGGGQAQILVRVKTRAGSPYVGVQVQLKASEGSLFSKGRILKTDGRGMVRDRLTTTKTSTITINAGGTTQKLWVAVGDFSR